MNNSFNITFRPLDKDKPMANGHRNCELVPLTDEEIEFVKNEIIAIKADKDMDIFIFNDPEHVTNPQKGTGYDPIEDKIYITKNVFPDDKYGSIHPRDNMSVRAVLAHEYYGHRPYRNEYLNDAVQSTENNIIHTTPVWLDECRASINASKLCPNLSQLDKANLIRDAFFRAHEYNKDTEIVLDDYMKGVLYGYDNNERNIVPPITPIKYISKRSTERKERERPSIDDMPEMPQDSEDYFGV